jgi:glycosyltransferase involved in cell wall biosynthesis
LGTGINAALQFSPKVIVTFDADGQHDPDDVPRLIEPIEKGEADMVNGSRLLNPEGMPWYRQVANRVANLVTYVLFGVWTTDSQSGLRAFSRDAATRLQFMSSGMGVNSEILAEIVRNNLRFKEVPVRAIYTSYSLSKGQSLDVGLRTLLKLILVKVRRLGL